MQNKKEKRKRKSYIYIYIYINELTRKEIASLILGVLDAEMCRAKHKYKRRKLLLVRYSSFTL